METSLLTHLEVVTMLIAVIGSLCGACAWSYNYFRRELQEDHRYRAYKAREIAHGSMVFVYRRKLGRVLKKIDSFMGKPRSFRYFTTCLTIAFIYPLLFFLISWSLDGPKDFGGLSLLPSFPSTERSLLGAIALVWLLVAGLIAYHHDRIVNILRRNLIKCLRSRFGVWADLLATGLPSIAGLALASGLWSSAVLYSAGQGGLGAFVGAFLNTLAFVGAIAGVAFAAIGKRLPTAHACSFAGTSTLVFVAAVGFAGLVKAVSPAYGNTIVDMTPIAGTATLAIIVALYQSPISCRRGIVAGGLFGTFCISICSVIVLSIDILGKNVPSIPNPGTIAIVFFFLLLPFVNVMYDWVSWYITRLLSHRLFDSLEKQRNRYFLLLIIASHAAFDILFAILILCILVINLSFVFEIINHWNIISNNKLIFNIDLITKPWPAWFIGMILTTLLPNFLHIFILVSSIAVFWISTNKRRTRIANKLIKTNPSISSIREAAWYSVYTWSVSICLLVIFLILTIIMINELSEYVGPLLSLSAGVGANIVSYLLEVLANNPP